MLNWAQTPWWSHPDPKATDGFNDNSKANGTDNAAHVSAIMALGSGSAAYQIGQDSSEYEAQTTEEGKAEKEAEIYADIAAHYMFWDLWRCLGKESSIFKARALDDDAWNKCKHLVGEGFYDWFCARWG
jgi:hypothetical protein